MSARPCVSIVLATYNRREVVLNTLRQIEGNGLIRNDYEVIIVDNASDDVCDYPGIAVRRLERNLGSCAKALGVQQARGALILFLDDDSFPRPGCLARMIAHFEADPSLGAAGFTVHLSDGSQECSALPHVFVGCGVGLRASALQEVGGLDLSFFMQAEEYDLSWRLLQAGWKVEIFEDLQVDHLKSPLARRSERTTFYDIRNNLRIIARYLPQPFADIYREDWLQRYAWIAESAGHTDAFERGLAAGRRLAEHECRDYQDWRLAPMVLEQVFCWTYIEQRMTELYRQGIRDIVLADLGKNVYAFRQGAAAAGLKILAIADDRLAAPNRTYRDTGILATDEALSLGAQAYVVSNTSYVHSCRRCHDLTRQISRPVYNWFDSPSESGLSLCSTAQKARRV